MEIIKVESLTAVMANQIVEVWEESVKATHKFLSKEEIKAIRKHVPQAIDDVEDLIIVLDKNTIIAFMGITNKKLEMLFISPNSRGLGIGKMLIKQAITKYGVTSVDVNEDNDQAVGFYIHVGFEVFDRSELDDMGNPYPILHMKYSLS